MLVAYRGHHCPICKLYLRDLDRKLSEFKAIGVTAVAASTDTQEHAERSKAEWGVEHRLIAYGLSIGQARNWGLYISAGIKDGEPSLFAEPGLFLIRPDRTLYASSIQMMPFARPSLSDILAGLKFLAEKNCFARGEA